MERERERDNINTYTWCVYIYIYIYISLCGYMMMHGGDQASNTVPWLCMKSGLFKRVCVCVSSKWSQLLCMAKHVHSMTYGLNTWLLYTRVQEGGYDAVGWYSRRVRLWCVGNGCAHGLCKHGNNSNILIILIILILLIILTILCDNPKP